MKKSNIPPWLSASVAFLLLGLAAAQQKPAEPAEVPIDKEPHHHLVFENEYVRVFKVGVAPHEATLVHRHTRDYVVVTIGDAEVTNAVVGKEPKKWNFKDGDVTFLEATKEKSFAHKAVNESEKPFVNYTIELKQQAKSAVPLPELASLAACTSAGCQRIVASGDRVQCEVFIPGAAGSQVVLEDKPYLLIRLRNQVPNEDTYTFRWLHSGKGQKIPGASLTCEFANISGENR